MIGQLEMRRVPRRRDQRGAALLGMAVFLVVVATFMIPAFVFTRTTARVSMSSARAQQRIRALDAAMSEVTVQLRLARQARGVACYGGTDVGGGEYEFRVPRALPDVNDADGEQVDILVRCAVASGTTITSTQRVLDLQGQVRATGGSWDASAGALSKARVKYVDEQGGREATGFEMVICDWRLGRFTGTLNTCPA